jgi:serine/threonine protein kinase
MDSGIAKILAMDPHPAPPQPAAPPRTVGHATTGPGGVETQSGQAKGTPAFMAPEQARGEASRVGKASDVFGLGGILCVTLTGQPPFTRAGQAAAGDLEEAFARLDGCGADAERQARVERESWLRAAGEAFPPAAEAARARLREQAWALVRDEVTTQAQRLSSASPAEASAARQVLETLLGLPVLAGVRTPAALAGLPEPERQTWQALWQKVEELSRGPAPAR